MDSVKRLWINADVKNLSKIRQEVQDTIAALGVQQVVIDDIVLAVDEAVTNIIIHGYKGQPGMIDIEVCKEEDTLSICLRDQAPSFDPTRAAVPDLALPLEKRPLGKLGVFLIKNYVDEMIHELPPGGGNQLTLVKSISKGSKKRRDNGD